MFLSRFQAYCLYENTFLSQSYMADSYQLQYLLWLLGQIVIKIPLSLEHPRSVTIVTLTNILTDKTLPLELYSVEFNLGRLQQKIEQKFAQYLEM